MEPEDRVVVGFTMVAHSLFHAYELSIPLFIGVWLDAFSASAAILGIVVGVGYAAIGVGAVPGGILSDRYGSNRVVLASIGGMGLGFLLVSIAPNVVTLGLALVVWGAGASLYHPAGLSLLSRGTVDRGTALAFHGAAGNVGTILGPVSVSLLLVVLQWRIVAGLLVIPAIGSWALALALPLAEGSGSDGPTGSTRPGLQAATRGLFVGSFLVIFVVVILYGLYYRGILTFLPEILSDVPDLASLSALGYSIAPGQYIYAGLLAVGVLGQYAGGRLTAFVRPDRALIGVFGLLLVGALAFTPAAAAGLAPLLVVCFVLGFSIYATAPIYQATIANQVAADTHGLSYGYTYLAMFGIGAIGAPISGAALAYTEAGVLFAILAGIATLAMVVTLVLVMRD